MLLTFTDVARAQSNHPVDRVKGWGRETDIVTWLLVARIDARKRWPTAFYAYPLHIRVDECMALINGRELFGYPKYEYRYRMPASDAPATDFRLTDQADWQQRYEIDVHQMGWRLGGKGAGGRNARAG